MKEGDGYLVEAADKCRVGDGAEGGRNSYTEAKEATKARWLEDAEEAKGDGGGVQVKFKTL